MSRFCPRTPVRGFTLVEIALVVAITVILALVAFPMYQSRADKAKETQAIADIREIELAVEQYRAATHGVPASLADVGKDALLDPWGRAYRYLLHADSNAAQQRQDTASKPVNSEYDLYSVGKDGLTSAALSHANSRDDVVRAKDGSYVGLASAY